LSVVPAAASRWQQVVIEEILPRTPRVTSLFLQAALKRPVAGQHVDVRLTADDGYSAQRSYSIASAPDAARIELAVEGLQGGEVSSYLCEVARPGDMIEVRGPIGGHFIWRAEDGGPLLLVAGGSGIAPLMAIVRDWSVSAIDTPALLVYSARTWEDLVFRDELLTLQARGPHFMFIAVTTRGPRQRPDDFDRRLDLSSLREVLARWRETPRHVYVCGSNVFVEAVTGSLVMEAIPPARIRTERYGGPT
jgi:ferredoxin-NADP reductase